MKKTIIKIVAAVMLMAIAMSMAACGKKNIYDELTEMGYSIRVRYDADGAKLDNVQDVNYVDVFNANDLNGTANGKTGISLLDPEDLDRGVKANKDGSRFTKEDATLGVRGCAFMQTGWYTSRTPRVDSEGRALDEFGVLTSESGRAQAYVYSGKWDFDKDVVTAENLVDGEMVLYAAWVPLLVKYEFYAQDASGAFKYIGEISSGDYLYLPKLDTAQGKLDMKDFPEVEGKVFEAAYFDEELTEKLPDMVDCMEQCIQNMAIDYERGISLSGAPVIKIYTTWTDAE